MDRVADNVNPLVYEKQQARTPTGLEKDEDAAEEIDARDVFDLVRHICDPEHPLTLEELRVVQEEGVSVEGGAVLVRFTPTIPHCSMATLIGLSIRVLLLRALPSRLKVTVEVSPGSHASEHQVNKQLADKERVAAALENNNLIQIINQCINSF